MYYKMNLCTPKSKNKVTIIGKKLKTVPTPLKIPSIIKK